MHHICTAFAVVLFSAASAFCQLRDSVHTTPFTPSFYVEGAGNGISGSFNLDGKLFNQASLRLGVGGFGRVQVYSYESGGTYNRYIWKTVVVVSGQYLFFGPEKFLEAGIGMTIQPENAQGYAPYVPDNTDSIIPTLTIGYRYQPLESGFMFRVGFTPFFSSDFSSVSPYGGLSIGHTF